MLPEQSDMSWTPVRIFGEERRSRWLVLCDHATNTVPGWIENGSLGLAHEDMDRHIAYDVGSSGVALRLAERLDATAVMANYSRLVIDPNRGLDDPTLIRKLSDGSIVPANRNLDGVDVARRISDCYRPYHEEVARLAARRDDTVLISVHSFTPQMHNGDPRPWHIGILYADDARLSRPLIDLLQQDEALVVGENEPYSGHLSGDTIEQHGTREGRQNTLIELRNDLIETDTGQAQWAEYLANVLPTALTMAEGN